MNNEPVERLTQARSGSLELIRPLTPEQWTRRGTVLGSEVSILDFGTWLANHDRGRDHLPQIQQMRRG